MIDAILNELTDEYAALPEVLALVHSGSRVVGNQDAHSDIDLYIYSREPVPLTARRALIGRRASRMEVGNQFAEESDVWTERDSGVQVDAIFRPAASFEDHVTWLLDKFEARQGNSTAIWHNLMTSRILFDREGWFARLRQRATRPYPDALAEAIIALNVPQLREAIHSHPHRVALALSRGDIVAINEALSNLLASYFDILFALNRTTHPGAKRLLQLSAALPLLPQNSAEDVRRLLSFTADALDDVPAHIDLLVEPLLSLLEAHGQLPPAWGEVVSMG